LDGCIFFIAEISKVHSKTTKTNKNDTPKLFFRLVQLGKVFSNIYTLYARLHADVTVIAKTSSNKCMVIL